MSARKNKIRVSRLFYARFYGKTIWRSAEEVSWLEMTPVGREFGSPDYERLMAEDSKKRAFSFA
jgi:hypothetical protein